MCVWGVGVCGGGVQNRTGGFQTLNTDKFVLVLLRLLHQNAKCVTCRFNVSMFIFIWMTLTIRRLLYFRWIFLKMTEMSTRLPIALKRELFRNFVVLKQDMLCLYKSNERSGQKYDARIEALVLKVTT